MEEMITTLKMIPQLLDLVNELKNQTTTEKRWLSVAEAAQYLPFKKDTIYKKLDTTFIEGTHFYRQDNTVIMDRIALDLWVTHKKASKINAQYIVADLLS